MHDLRRNLLSFAASIATLLVAAGPASASDFDAARAEGPQALLAASDAAQNPHEDNIWRFEMTVTPKGSDGRTLEFKVWQRGKDRLVRFLSGEMKGMAILTKRGDEMDVFLPGTGVRRVAAHAKRQPLLGSNLDYSDMSTEHLSARYEATFDGDVTEGGHQWLVLTPKDGAEDTWDKLRVRVAGDTTAVDAIEYFDDGERVREERRTERRDLGGAEAYTLVTMTSLDSGLVTTLRMLEQEAGADLERRMFTKRHLVRGR